LNHWKSLQDELPNHEQRVIAFIPDNYVYLPGKTGEKRHTPILILKFIENFFKEDNPKRLTHGSHFWLGEGQSNHYFGAVTHWMELPAEP
jgi:hypothetical protein